MAHQESLFKEAEKIKSTKIVIWLMVVLVFGSVSTTFPTVASFQGLGDLPGGSFSSETFDIMPASAFVDNFSNLAGWTRSRMISAYHQVKAITGGSYGVISVANADGANKEYRLAFDIIPDKTDTTGRFIFAGLAKTTTTLAFGVGYVAGTGIVVTGMHNSGIVGPITAVADAYLTTGERYHCELFYRWNGAYGTQATCIVQVYDKYGVFVGGESKGVTASSWFTAAQIIICGNSNASTISRYAFQPGYFASSTTQDYITNTAVGFREIGAIGTGDANKMAGLCIPGRINSQNLVAIIFHGAATWNPGLFMRGTAANWWGRREWNSPPPYWLITEMLMNMGIPVIAPYQYSDTASSHLSWACPEVYNDICNGGWADGRDWMQWARDELGPDVKFIVVGQSMGALLAARMVAQGDVSDDIVALGLFRGVTDLFEAWNTGAWQAQLEAAWDISPVDAAEAHTLLDPYDPHDLVVSNPERWRCKYVQLTHSDEDTTVRDAKYSDALKALLTTESIDYTDINYVYGEHASPLFRTGCGYFAEKSRLDLSNCTNEPESDLSGDGKVNFVDFSKMASEWLQDGTE